ncbi:MAG: CotH kinase family protein [Acidobacteriota bacterium]|nr:CotH kinase family protein [Acidobacteriota bacterium]
MQNKFYVSLLPTLLALGQAMTGLGSEPFISEIVAANDRTLKDDFGETSDWVELYNPGETAANLLGWGLSDEPESPMKWVFPGVSIPPGEFMVIHASGNNIAEPGKPLHTSFRLARAGEFLGLAKPDGTFADKYEPGYPALTDNQAFGVPMMGKAEQIIPAHATFQYLTPSRSHETQDWTKPDFKPTTSWKNGQSGFGFQRTGSNLTGLIKTKVSTSKRVIWTRKKFTIKDRHALGYLILRIQFDDGFIAYLNGEKIASQNAPANPKYNSYATSNNNNDSYMDFDLGEYVHLLKNGSANVLAVQAFDHRSDRNEFFLMPILIGGAEEKADPSNHNFLTIPTPGRLNSSPSPPMPGTPIFSKESDSFTSSLSITLKPSVPGETIRYTSNGKLPSSTSKKYTGAIRISKSSLITARCFTTDGFGGPPITHEYLQIASNARKFTSNLPVVVIENFKGGGIPSDPYKNAYMTIYEPSSDKRTSLMDNPTLGTRVGIKIRGSSTQNRPKKAFTIEARDDFGEDRDITPLGLPEESDWILYAPYNFDRALIRNALIYELSNQIGRYAVRTRFCEVFVNTNGGALSYNDYVGVYVFMEKIKRDKNRVDITRINPEDTKEPELTGGYMFKIDRPDPGDSGFSAGGQSVKWVDPKEDEVTAKQSGYVRNYFNNAYKNLNHKTKYADYIDPLSWIDHHMLNEFTKNPDGLRLSTYFFKDRNKRIEYGPVWDFDRTMGCDDDGRAANPVGWSGSYIYGWWSRIIRNKTFKEQYAQRWGEVRGNVMSEKNIFTIINEWENLLNEAAQRNFTKWRLVNSKTGFQTEIKQLKNWISQRLKWMDTQFDSIPSPLLSMTEGSVLPGFSLGVSAQSNEVYYTADGTDPRMADGSINPSAIRLGKMQVEPFIQKGAEWKYLDTGVSLNRKPWTTIDYDDNDWKAGKAELGYGDGDEATAVDRGPDPSTKYHTTIYFRKPFQIDEFTNKALLINLLRDDGAVVYLNGEELFRSNMKVGTIRSSSYSEKRNSSRDSRKFFSYFIDLPNFKQGANIFAVEVHRGSRYDKDLSFNFEATLMDAAGIPVTIEKSSTITVRAKSGDIWSAPSTASVVISPAAALKITELMYNPIDGKVFEFIELKNTAAVPLNLAGVSLSGVQFTFDDQTLAPWESGLLIPNDDPAAFLLKHPDAPLLGTYGGSLSNSGEEISLLDPDGQVVYTVNYSTEDPWPSAADGGGSSLELLSGRISERDPGNWRASLVTGGTPGDILFTEINRTDDGRVAIQFLALPGNSYSLHSSDDVASGDWKKLEVNEFVTDTKVVKFVVSPEEGSRQRFYRVSSP